MASSELVKKFMSVTSDFSSITSSPSFGRISSDSSILTEFNIAHDLAKTWIDYLSPFLNEIDDLPLQNLTNYATKLLQIAENCTNANSPVRDRIIDACNGFRTDMPLVMFFYLKVTGMLNLTPDMLSKMKKDFLMEINNKENDAISKIKETYCMSREDYECLKNKLTKISITDSLKQFEKTNNHLSKYKWGWTFFSGVCLLFIITFFVCIFNFPPKIIERVIQSIEGKEIMYAQLPSMPILIAACAYYTSIRLCVIGMLSYVFAFSLKMMRAYFHMVEYNNYKINIANSMQNLIDSVRDAKEKDHVFEKLVDSVISFGDSGILGKSADKSSEFSVFPSIVVDAITKNVGKNE
jgi:hypothetical protein